MDPIPAGRWAHDHDACVDCGTREAPHYGKGRCELCWRAWKARERWASLPGRARRERLEQMRAYVAARRAEERKAAKKAVRSKAKAKAKAK